MHQTVKNLIDIKTKVDEKFNKDNKHSLPKIIAVSKTFKLDHIKPLIDFGHKHFGENKVQEAIEKWTNIKKENKNIKLHLIGRLQSNKVKNALRIFDYIHSLDNEKLANKISQYQKENNLNTKLFIQINIGNEEQKSGIDENNINNFYNYCKNLNLNIIGLMCIPPVNINTENYFKKMQLLKNKIKLDELSMGMSSDYLTAIKFDASYIRLGSSIFGQRN